METESSVDLPPVEKTGIYSPRQVASSGFFGGPLAAVYVLKKNYDALGNKTGSRKVLIYGGIFLFVVLFSAPFLPSKFPNYLLPLAYALAAEQIAAKYQMTKEAIATSPVYRFHSCWRVFGLSVVCFFAFIIPMFVWIVFVFQMEGVIHLDQDFGR